MKNSYDSADRTSNWHALPATPCHDQTSHGEHHIGNVLTFHPNPIKTTLHKVETVLYTRRRPEYSAWEEPVTPATP